MHAIRSIVDSMEPPNRPDRVIPSCITAFSLPQGASAWEEELNELASKFVHAHLLARCNAELIHPLLMAQFVSLTDMI